MKKIIIDLEGSDHGPEVLFSGARKAAEKYPQLSFSLVTTNAVKFKNEINTLKESLANSDYKVIKRYEASLRGKEMPYDFDILSLERQSIRDRINELELTIKDLCK